MMRLKLFLSHILITLISAGFLALESFIGDRVPVMVIGFFYLFIILVLYVASGYFFTAKNQMFNIKNYGVIALIGIVLWFVAVLNSPSNLDLGWKISNGEILWHAYRIYVFATELPFWFIFYGESIKNVYLEASFLLILTIIPSVTQAFGGYLKTKR